MLILKQRKGHKKHDDEDELAKVERQIVSPEEIRDIELAAEKRRHRNFQEGGSSSSSSLKAKPNAKKRGASKSPETLRYDDPESAHEPINQVELSHEPKNKISQRAIKINESHELAIASGTKKEHHTTMADWKIAFGGW